LEEKAVESAHFSSLEYYSGLSGKNLEIHQSSGRRLKEHGLRTRKDEQLRERNLLKNLAVKVNYL